MRLIARKYMPEPKLLTASEYRQWRERGIDNAACIAMIARGEPYFIRGRPLIIALGVGGYWRQLTPAGVHVYGEALEPLEPSDQLTDEVLKARREGYVLGRWHSKLIPEGEMGYVHQRHLTPLSSLQFLEALRQL